LVIELIDDTLRKKKTEKEEKRKEKDILLDMAMPQFSGYDVLDTLKKEGLLVKIRKHSNFYCILQLSQIPLMIS
jgi:CheY-like chemotaxis protein